MGTQKYFNARTGNVRTTVCVRVQEAYMLTGTLNLSQSEFHLMVIPR
jgi:hypothetical protein